MSGVLPSVACQNCLSQVDRLAAMRLLKPRGYLPIHVGVAEQFAVPHSITDPLAVLGNRQRSRRVPMPSQGAVERHKPVTDQSIAQHAAIRRAYGGCRIALYAGGQRHEFPICRDRAVAQVGNTRASCPAQMRKRREIRTQFHYLVESVAAAFQRRAVMRRAKKYELAEMRRPLMPCRTSVMTGASSDKSTHAVPHDRQFLERRSAIADQGLQHFCERESVTRNWQATVIAQVERQIPEVIGKRCPVVVPVAVPLPVVHAQPVHEHEEFVCGRHIPVLSEHAYRIVEVDKLTAITQAHINRERIPGPQKVVTVHAVRHGSVCIERWRGLTLRQKLRERRQTHVGSLANKASNTANAAIHEAGYTLRTTGRRYPQWSWPRSDSAVHLLDGPGDYVCSVGGHTHTAAQVRQL